MTAVFWHIVSPDEPIVSLTLPPKLFYVRHGRSQAYATDDGGFIARAPDRDIGDEEELKANATKHFSWPTRDWASCFVSAFGDQEHAEKWGRRPCHWSPVKVYELDTHKLPPGTLVLNAFMLCTFLGIDHSYNKMKDEFLFYQGIPGSCVERSWDPRGGDCPEARFPRYKFSVYWFQVVALSLAEQAQTRNKAQLTVSSRDMETHQEHGVEGEHRKPMRSAAEARRERRRQIEEYERQKSAESNINTIHDPDVNDLSGHMKVLDLETDVDTHTSPNTPNTTPRSTTTAVATTTPESSARTTTTAPLRLSVSQIMRRRRELEELERQKSAEHDTNTLHDMDPDVNDLAGDGQMKVLDLQTDVDTRESHTTPSDAANTVPNTTTTTTATPAATNTGGSAAAGVATGPLRGSVSQIRAIRQAQREAEERKLRAVEGEGHGAKGTEGEG